MKKGLFRYFKLSMFRGLFTSMLGVVLLTCGIMGIVMLDYSMKRMRQEENKLLESKLYSIAVDFENQMNTMQEIQADLSSRQEFRWDQVSANKINELLALQQLQNYDRVSDIWNLFFVKYRDYDYMMSSNADVTDMELYLSKYYSEEDVKEIFSILERMYQTREKTSMVYSNGKTSLFLFSTIRLGGSNMSKIVVGFEVPQKFIEKRIAELVGELEGEISISYKDKTIYGGVPSPEEENEMLQLNFGAGDFAVYYKSPEYDYFSWKSVFTAKSLFLFVVVGLFMLLLIFGLTVWNYRPVRKLAAKYIPMDGGEVKSALDSIDRLIDDLQKNRARDDRLLQEQHKALKEQLAYLVISGCNLNSLKNYMTLLNIDYNNSQFGVITCQIQEKHLPDMEVLNTAIIDLSDEEVLLYPSYHREMGLKVLVVAEEGYQFTDAVDLLSSLFTAMKLEILPILSARSTNLEDWSELTAEESIANTESANSNEKMKSLLKHAVRYVENHHSEYDLSLSVVAQKIGITPSYLSHLFKEELGVGFKEYVIELRISKAKELLADPRYSVGDVCQQVGYVNTSHFIKLFQKYTGMTPAKFREEN